MKKRRRKKEVEKNNVVEGNVTKLKREKRQGKDRRIGKGKVVEKRGRERGEKEEVKRRNEKEGRKLVI